MLFRIVNQVNSVCQANERKVSQFGVSLRTSVRRSEEDVRGKQHFASPGRASPGRGTSIVGQCLVEVLGAWWGHPLIIGFQRTKYASLPGLAGRNSRRVTLAVWGHMAGWRLGRLAFGDIQCFRAFIVAVFPWGTFCHVFSSCRVFAGA